MVEKVLTFKEARKEFLKNYFNDLLVLSLGNISLAAKKAQLHRRHIHRIITELDIDTESHRRELVKPAEYMKENIHQILEGTLSGFDESKIKRIYSNLDDISQIIAEHIGHHSYEDAVEVFEKEYLEKALKNNEYNVQRTAAAIDVGKRTLYRKMSKLNIAVA